MMKRLIAAVALVLLLTGCGVQEAVETTVATVATEPTQPSGYYVPGSRIEKDTNGAVRQYQLPEQVQPVIASMGEKMLLITASDQPEMILLEGEDAVPVNRVQLPSGVEPGQEYFRVTRHGVVYYDAAAGAVVWLDPQLQETNRILLNGDMTGQPLIAADGNQVFYCTGTEIFSVDAANGTVRPVRSFVCEQAELLFCAFEGRLLGCQLKKQNGVIETVYISGQTGETLIKNQNLQSLVSRGVRYFAHRVDGTVDQLLVGTWDSEPMLLSGLEGHLVPGLQLNGVAGWSVEEQGLLLSFRQLHIEEHASGSVIPDGNVLLPDWGEPSAFMDDDNSLWLLATHRQTGEMSLLRWDIGKTPVEATQTVIAPLYTADAPDEAGLQVCQERVDALNKTHGVRIRIWKEAVRYSNTEVLETEYQPKAINAVLDRLEPLLGQFPEGFLSNCANDKIRICIVRSIDGGTQGTQYWNDGDAFIVLTAGGDIENDFLKALGSLVDSHILGNSSRYDYWKDLNPTGFKYGDSDTYSTAYLQGETRAFADEAGMTSVVEDRSGIFREALRRDNSTLFESTAMQEKLRQLCLAIRDAWRLKKSTQIYPWEQYLTEPVAYQG